MSETESEFELDDIDEKAYIETVEYQPVYIETEPIENNYIYNIECQDLQIQPQSRTKEKNNENIVNPFQTLSESPQSSIHQPNKSPSKFKQPNIYKKKPFSAKKSKNNVAFLLNNFSKDKETYNLDFIFKNSKKKTPKKSKTSQNSKRRANSIKNLNQATRQPQIANTTTTIDTQNDTDRQIINSISSPKSKILVPIFEPNDKISLLESVKGSYKRKKVNKSPQPEIRFFQYQLDVEVKRQKLSQQLDEEKHKECTFMPNTKNSEIIKKTRPLNVFLELQAKHQKTLQNKIQKQQNEQADKQQQDYKLLQSQKLICRGSQNILKQKQRNMTPIHDRLYTMNQNKMLKQTNNDYNLFKKDKNQKNTPRITNKSKQILKDKSMQDILYQYGQKRQHISPLPEKREDSFLSSNLKKENDNRSFLTKVSENLNHSYFTKQNIYQQSDNSQKVLKDKFDQEINDLFQKYTYDQFRSQKLNYYGLKMMLEQLHLLDNEADHQQENQLSLVKKI